MEHYFTNNENLKSEIKMIKYDYDTYSLTFLSDNGVFSKTRIDYGSKLLVETFLKNNQIEIKNILDVGCGYGFIGITLSKVLNAPTTLIDINKRAVHLTERNIKENKVNAQAFVSNIYENIKDKFSVIITNPPIRAGKEVVLEILRKARDYLDIDGILWFVIKKDQGAKTIAKNISDLYEVECLKKDKGFYIFRAKKR